LQFWICSGSNHLLYQWLSITWFHGEVLKSGNFLEMGRNGGCEQLRKAWCVFVAGITFHVSSRVDAHA
jgi:hypothetical protein